MSSPIRVSIAGASGYGGGELLRLLLGAGYTPVIAPLALGREAELLNVDGDRAAALVAASLSAATLVILSNVPGLLASFPDDASLVRHLPPDRLDWAEGLAQGRMKKKVLAAREALAGGVSTVVLADSRLPQPVQAALAGGGTWVGRLDHERADQEGVKGREERETRRRET